MTQANFINKVLNETSQIQKTACCMIYIEFLEQANLETKST